MKPPIATGPWARLTRPASTPHLCLNCIAESQEDVQCASRILDVGPWTRLSLNIHARGEAFSRCNLSQMAVLVSSMQFAPPSRRRISSHLTLHDMNMCNMPSRLSSTGFTDLPLPCVHLIACAQQDAPSLLEPEANHPARRAALRIKRILL
jgi:hypothetical protein